MKNYFGFTLTGKKFLPVWLIFYVLFIIPYVFVVLKMNSTPKGIVPSGLIFVALFALILVALFLTFYITKILIENIQYNGKSVTFNGKFGSYVGTVIVGFILSIITLGIYMAWFIKNIYSFFIDNSSYENESFKFRGKGGQLFVIFLLTLFVPIFLVTIITTTLMIANPGNSISAALILQQVVILIVIIPYIYLIYKWRVNIDYKSFNAKLETEFWGACGNIALQILLCIITIGIYTPMAVVKLYKYFADKTVAQSADIKIKFGFDADNMSDFLFLWGQMLLTIITLGIYYPWCISKVGSRILGRTYLE